MNYEYYLTAVNCLVFVKPTCRILKQVPEYYILKNGDRTFLSGRFIEIKKISDLQESVEGGLQEFYFVDRYDMSDFQKLPDKRKYIYKITLSEIVSIELIFDEIAFGKETMIK
jgi:hypothetical protein